jgi:hypothetical protein
LFSFKKKLMLMFRRVYCWGIVLFFLTGCTFNTPKSKQDKADLIHKLNNQLTEALILGTFSPPAASRVYAYANIAAYEAMIQGNDSFVSLAHQVHGIKVIPIAEHENYVPEIAMTVAFCKISNSVVWHDYLLDSTKKQILDSLFLKHTKKEIEYSISYGDKLASAILKCMDTDGYKETRKMPLYTPLKKEWSWETTPPKYAEAIEPWWYTIHPLILDSASQFRSDGPNQFSIDPQSKFYKEAYEVYKTKGLVMMEDTAIANFWDCNPFLTKREGHVTYAVRQISPGGHWIGITQIACKKSNLNIQQCCEIYALTAIAISDAFISCWDTKYHFNSIRPITYINRYIDAKWSPILETPPFPEYTSGHSVISAAAATVLAKYFGNTYIYTDNVEVPYGKAPRNFHSFKQASEEAAISRLYGGIHYVKAIEDGKLAGEKVGTWVNTNLKTRRK